MKSTAPKELGILVIAAVFGIIGGGVALVAFGLSLVWSVFFAGVVAVVTAVALWLGWREPTSRRPEQGYAGQAAPRTTEQAAAAQAAHRPGARAEPRADKTASDAGFLSEAPAVVETETARGGVDGDSDAVDLSKTEGASEARSEAGSDDETRTDGFLGNRVKPSACLEGQEELASRKGSWRYEAPRSDGEGEGSGDGSAQTHYGGSGAAAATANPVSEAAGEKPRMLEAPRDGGPDNLKEIKGIGPKLETMLHEMGVFHFDQIAGWSDSELAWVDSHLEGFRGRASRDEWVSQAKVLASGGDTDFSRKVDGGDVY